MILKHKKTKQVLFLLCMSLGDMALPLVGQPKICGPYLPVHFANTRFPPPLSKHNSTKVHWKNPFSCHEENQALQTPQTFILVAIAPSCLSQNLHQRLWVPRPSPQPLPITPRSTLMLLRLHLCPCSLLNT
jgi:hypothetical protein